MASLRNQYEDTPDIMHAIASTLKQGIYDRTGQSRGHTLLPFAYHDVENEDQGPGFPVMACGAAARKAKHERIGRAGVLTKTRTQGGAQCDGCA